jgi:hypothetical protein
MGTFNIQCRTKNEAGGIRIMIRSKIKSEARMALVEQDARN